MLNPAKPMMMTNTAPNITSPTMMTVQPRNHILNLLTMMMIILAPKKMTMTRTTTATKMK